MLDLRFKSWLQEVLDDPYSCKCSFCGVTLTCGLSKLEPHLEIAEHQRKTKVFETQHANVLPELVRESIYSYKDQKHIFEIRYAALLAHN